MGEQEPYVLIDGKRYTWEEVEWGHGQTAHFRDGSSGTVEEVGFTDGSASGVPSGFWVTLDRWKYADTEEKRTQIASIHRPAEEPAGAPEPDPRPRQFRELLSRAWGYAPTYTEAEEHALRVYNEIPGVKSVESINYHRGTGPDGEDACRVSVWFTRTTMMEETTERDSWN